MTPLCAKGDPDSEFVCALRNCLGDDAVEPNCCEHKCQACKGAKEPGDELAASPLGCTCDPVLEVARVAIGLLVVIDGIDLDADGVEQSERRAVRTDEDLRKHSHTVGVGDEGLRAHRLGEAIVELIGDNADNEKAILKSGRGEEVGRLLFELRQAKAVADGVSVGEVAASEGLVDDDHQGAMMILRFIPDAAFQDRDF